MKAKKSILSKQEKSLRGKLNSRLTSKSFVVQGEQMKSNSEETSVQAYSPDDKMNVDWMKNMELKDLLKNERIILSLFQKIKNQNAKNRKSVSIGSLFSSSIKPDVSQEKSDIRKCSKNKKLRNKRILEQFNNKIKDYYTSKYSTIRSNTVVRNRPCSAYQHTNILKKQMIQDERKYAK